MPNNIMNFGPSRTTARKFAAVQKHRNRTVSKTLIRALLSISVAAAILAVVFVWVKFYRVTAPPPVPPLGQWSLVKDEEIAIEVPVGGGKGGGLRAKLETEETKASDELQSQEKAAEPAVETTVEVTTVPRRPRKIVLSTSNDRINTGENSGGAKVRIMLISGRSEDAFSRTSGCMWRAMKYEHANTHAHHTHATFTLVFP